MTLLNRSGLAAIAAATALLSTPALAQDAAPVAADPPPIVADTPLPVERTPAPTDPVEAVSDPIAPAEATTTTTSRATRSVRPARTAVAPATRIPATTARASTAAPVVSTAPTPDATPAIDPAMVAAMPEPAATTPAVATDDRFIDNDLLPIAGAVGLGILAIAGAGLAVRRRRREDDVVAEDDVVVEETFHEPSLRRDEPLPLAAAVPIAIAPIIANPAFNWGVAAHETAPPESRIEAARRGPTPDNPSLSLKKRLQRAAFFDQRERTVAAGEAAPMSSMAGLPDALVETPSPAVEPAGRP